MRRLVPLAILLAAALGCGKTTTNTADDAPARPAAAAAFDENSADNTLAWVAARMLESEKVPAGNEAARKEAAAKLRADVAGTMEGKSVRWAVRVGQVNSRGQCCISSLSKNLGRRDEWGDADRIYQLGIVPPYPAGWAGRPFGQEHGSLPNEGFGSNPPGAAWIKTTASGDRVVLVGRVSKAVAGGLFVLVAVEGHVERP